MFKKLKSFFFNKENHSVKKTILILWGIIFLLGFGFSTIAIFFHFGVHRSVEIAKDLFSAGPSFWNIIFFLLLFVVRNIFFLPISLLLALGGSLFGIWLGLLLSGIGEIIGATMGFFFARYYGREFFEAKENSLLEIINKKAEKHGFLTIFVLRFLPVIPFDLINFAAGLSRIPFFPYFLATALSIWPDCLFFVLIGGSFRNPHMILFAVIISFFIFGFLWYIKNHPHFRELLEKISNRKK